VLGKRHSWHRFENISVYSANSLSIAANNLGASGLTDDLNHAAMAPSSIPRDLFSV